MRILTARRGDPTDTPGRTTSTENDALITRLRRRDQAAFAELYDRMSGRAFGLAYRVLGERTLAEDVVHDAFLSLWEQVDRLDARRGAVEGLVLTIVHRRAVDAVRARRRRSDHAEPVAPDFDPIDEDAADLYEAAVRTLSREAIEEALTALAGDQRRAIELAYFGGLTMAEIASAVDAPLGTVKSRVRLGLARLRETIGVEWSGR